MRAAENRGRGRPTRLTPQVVDALAAQLAAGANLTDAARSCGVSPRTLRAWRQRAWSNRPEDRLHVQLERRVLAALPRPGSRIAGLVQPGSADAEPWEAAALRLVANEQWRLDFDAELDGFGREFDPGIE